MPFPFVIIYAVYQTEAYPFSLVLKKKNTANCINLNNYNIDCKTGKLQQVNRFAYLKNNIVPNDDVKYKVPNRNSVER